MVLWDAALGHLNSGNHSSALPYLHNLVELDPTNGDLLFNYGACLYEMQDFTAASAQLKKAAEAGLKNPQLLPLLGGSFNNAGMYDEAISTYKTAILAAPQETVLIERAWSIFERLQRLEDAIEYFSHLVKELGRTPLLVFTLGQAYLAAEQFENAELMFSERINADSDDAVALKFLAATKSMTGEVYQAIDLYRRASELAKISDVIQNDHLMSLNYSEHISQQELIEAHNSWGNEFADELSSIFDKNHDFNPGRPIRLGYVSSDFGYHAVGNFIRPVLEAHDRQRFELIGYSNFWSPDPMTEIIKNLFDEWRNIWQMDGGDVGRQIVADKIDILIDLNGHTAGSSLDVFKKKPAPLQVSWLGYPNATGLAQIDFMIGDEIVAPPELDGKNNERSAPLRLAGGYHCYNQWFESQVADPPAEENGFITFASFNTLAKLTDKTIKLWSSALNAIPGSRLLLKRSPLKSKFVRDNLLKRFQGAGIGGERIQFEWEIISTANHLKSYEKVDIALDSFPYGGTTTTCDALWMGVPVVTLRGEQRSSRVSASILHQIGKSEWVADTEQSFVRIVKDLSEDIGLLKNIRKNLRDQFMKSSLYQNDIVTKKLETVLQTEWHRLCGRIDR